MENRKNPEKDLRRTRGLFFQIGLFVALLLVVSAFQWRTSKDAFIILHPEPSSGDMINVLPTRIDPPDRPKPKPLAITVVAAKPEEEIIDYQPVLDPDIEIEIPVNLPGPDIEIAEKVKNYAEQMPTPVGGYEEFYRFVSKNVKYTAAARNVGIEGTIYISFIVDKEGKLSEIKVAKGIGGGLDEQALEALKKFPAWNPARQGGRNVKVRMMIPIRFNLQ